MFCYKFDFRQIRQTLIFCIANLVYELPYQLLNNLRIRISEKSETIDYFILIILLFYFKEVIGLFILKIFIKEAKFVGLSSALEEFQA